MTTNKAGKHIREVRTRRIRCQNDITNRNTRDGWQQQLYSHKQQSFSLSNAIKLQLCCLKEGTQMLQIRV